MATIGIDARAAAEEVAGRGRYVREILLALSAADGDHRYVLHARERWPAPLDERFSWDLTSPPDPVWHLHVAAKARRQDVLFSTNSYLTSWFSPVPCAVAVHDLIPWVPGAAAQSRAARIEKATIRPAIRRAGALLCVSEATKRDLLARFPRARGKAYVTPLAPAVASATLSPARRDALLAEMGLAERRFVLSVGTIEPRKNLLRLIAAHGRLPDPVRSRNRLVIVGPQGWDSGEILQGATGRPGDVLLLGRRSEEELAALYAGCAAFAYCSLYEGFGLPLLEAMAAGAACLTSGVSSLPEVGGEAVMYADPLDPDDMARQLERLLTEPDLTARLRSEAAARARAYSWDRTAALVQRHLLELTSTGDR